MSQKLIVSSESISCHEFASQFGLEFVLYAKKNHKHIVNTVARMLFISMDHRPAIVSPASKAVRPTMTESWLGAPKQRTATVVGGVSGCASVCTRERACMRACMMCLQYTIIIFYPG